MARVEVALGYRWRLIGLRLPRGRSRYQSWLGLVQDGLNSVTYRCGDSY
jgi:hypothetical protein